MFKKPVWDDLSFVTLSCWKKPSEDGYTVVMDMVSNNTQEGSGI